MAEREFLLPDLGEGLEEGEVVTWRVSEGDRVELNQPLVEVNTAKALVEIPSPFEGVVVKLHAAEGDVVEVGKPLVTFELGDGAEEPPESGEAAGDGSGEPKRRAVLVGYGVAEEAPEGAAGAARRARRSSERTRVAASPPVRRLAKELGIDLAAVPGTGPKGRVTREDVERAAAAGQDEAAAGAEHIPVRGTRRLVAQKMARSAREIPHVTTFLTLDAFNLEQFRGELAAESGQRVSPLPVVVRALADVCGIHRKLNASFHADEGEILLYRDCHVGVATDTERGLVVTVVRDAGSKGILEIGDEIGRLSKAARDGTIKPDQMTGSTITVTNVGSFGAEYGTPIINYPESAILATGVVEERALVVDGEVVARPSMTLSLSFDHRLLDGAEAGRALRELGDLLESPFRLGSLSR